MIPSGRFLLSLALCCGAVDRGFGDSIVFDEDDPIGADYYDSSVASAKAPSRFAMASTERNKMPVLKGTAQRGEFSGVCQWESRSSGSWNLRVYSPGFRNRDIRGHQSLVFYLNGPSSIAAPVLPALALESADRERSSLLPLGRFLATGVDADAHTWQKVEIPLAALIAGTRFDSAHFSRVLFTQDAADGREHILWLDNIRFTSTNASEQVRAPAAPSHLVTRPGDRAICLHWDVPIQDESVRYQIYRSPTPAGNFNRIANVPTQSFADVEPENGSHHFYKVTAIDEGGESAFSEIAEATPLPFANDDAFLEFVERSAFDYFWYEANPASGMIRDRSEPFSAASIAAIGFGLTGIGIAVDRQWITREQGAERALKTLHTLWHTPQGPASSGTSGYRGWFYHFLEMENGLRAGGTELSSIDTGLLLMGVIYAHEFFDAANSLETQIREHAQRIYERVDWNWMRNEGPTPTHGWYPERGFIKSRWEGYSEASLLYIPGLGAEGENALPERAWPIWTSSYKWETHSGFSFVPFAPLFGHQYTACWIDLRSVADDFMRAHRSNYFKNSRQATLAQQAYCIENPKRHAGYNELVWGLTACDGPGSNGFLGYMARGAPPPEHDDGTIAPTAAGGSIVFTPRESLRTLKYFYERYRTNLWCGYGFRDAFNLEANWWGPDVIGIDQGPILLMIENYRSGRVWKVMEKSPIIQRGLKRAGFKPIRAEDTR